MIWFSLCSISCYSPNILGPVGALQPHQSRLVKVRLLGWHLLFQILRKTRRLRLEPSQYRGLSRLRDSLRHVVIKLSNFPSFTSNTVKLCCVMSIACVGNACLAQNRTPASGSVPRLAKLTATKRFSLRFPGWLCPSTVFNLLQHWYSMMTQPPLPVSTMESTH